MSTSDCWYETQAIDKIMRKPGMIDCDQIQQKQCFHKRACMHTHTDTHTYTHTT